jgi:glycolate oxidase FAD binding subunit
VVSAPDLAVGGPARDAGPADTVGGVQPRFVAAPRDAESLAQVLARCAEEGLSAVARGDGTKLDWGHPPSTVDVVVDTGRLAGVLGHSAPDLVVTVGAGTPVRAVQALLARSGQRLALDPPSVEATVGGMLATAEAGPLRHTFGAPRDLLLGVEFVRADGTFARAGARLAAGGALGALGDGSGAVGTGRGDGYDLGGGYDLGRLLCGSYGTLGVLASATFRLHPAPVRRAWVVRAVHNPAEVAGLVSDLLDSVLAPTAIEVDLPSLPVLPRQRDGGPIPGGQLAVLFEGSVEGVPARCQVAEVLLRGGVSTVDEAPVWWGRYPFSAADVALRLSAPVAGLATALYALRDAAGVPFRVRGSAGVGVVHAVLPATVPEERLAAALAAVRSALAVRGGNCVVLCAPSPLREALDLWGPTPGVALLRRIKEQFDPRRLLAPGRFVGGI